MPPRVPILDLAAQHAPLRDALLAAMARVLDSGRYVLGPEVERFEADLARFAGAPHAVGVSSGSDALLVTLMALGIGASAEGARPGEVDEVVTTSLSFFATCGAIARLGARPVFVDVAGPDAADPFFLDVEQALARVTPRTRAIVVVPLFGAPLPPGAIERLASASVPIIVDGAQAIGAPDLCAAGVRAVTLSFFPSKNLGALGDGGAVLTADAALADRVRLLRQHGSRPKYHHAVVGGNFRLDALQAALLSTKLPHLPAWTAARRDNARAYRLALSDLAGLRLPALPDGHAMHHFVVRTEGRDALRAHLADRGVETEIYYPEPLHLQPCFAHLGHRPGDLPHVEAACRQSLALPVHPALDAAQRDHLIETVRSFFG